MDQGPTDLQLTANFGRSLQKHEHCSGSIPCKSASKRAWGFTSWLQHGEQRCCRTYVFEACWMSGSLAADKHLESGSLRWHLRACQAAGELTEALIIEVEAGTNWAATARAAKLRCTTFNSAVRLSCLVKQELAALVLMPTSGLSDCLLSTLRRSLGPPASMNWLAAFFDSVLGHRTGRNDERWHSAVQGCSRDPSAISYTQHAGPGSTAPSGSGLKLHMHRECAPLPAKAVRCGAAADMSKQSSRNEEASSKTRKGRAIAPAFTKSSRYSPEASA